MRLTGWSEIATHVAEQVDQESRNMSEVNRTFLWVSIRVFRNQVRAKVNQVRVQGDYRLVEVQVIMFGPDAG